MCCYDYVVVVLLVWYLYFLCFLVHLLVNPLIEPVASGCCISPPHSLFILRIFSLHLIYRLLGHSVHGCAVHDISMHEGEHMAPEFSR